MNEPWQWLPEQQNRVIGDPEAPGPDTPGPGSPGGEGPETPTGPEDPSEGFDGPGGAADSPSRGGPTAGPEGRVGPAGDQEAPSLVDTVLGQLQEAWEAVKTRVQAEEPDLPMTPLGALWSQAGPQIANEIASLFGDEPDRFANTADPTGGEPGASGPEGRDGGTRDEDLPGAGGDDDEDPEAPPDWQDPAYREALRASLERLLGRQLAPGFELPNWGALISYEAPSPRHPPSRRPRWSRPCARWRCATPPTGASSRAWSVRPTGRPPDGCDPAVGPVERQARPAGRVGRATRRRRQPPRRERGPHRPRRAPSWPPRACRSRAWPGAGPRGGRHGTVTTGPGGRTIAVLPRTQTGTTPTTPPKPPPPPPTPPPRPPTPPPTPPARPPTPGDTGNRGPTGGNPAGPKGPGAGAVKPELEGGPIPTTENEWESRRLWEEFGRRQESAKAIRELAQMDAQRREATARASVYDERRRIALVEAGTARDQAAHELSVSTHLSTMSREAVRTAGVQADLLLGEEGQRALEFRRAAETAQINMDSATADLAALRVEQGQLRAVTASELRVRDLKIAETIAEAGFEIEDATLEAERANAEAVVSSAARGAGGSLVEQQQAGIAAETERRVGRVARKRTLATGQLQAQKAGVSARGAIAQAKVRTAIVKAGHTYQKEWKDRATARERETLTRSQATVRAGELRAAGRHEGAKIALQAAEATIRSDRAMAAARTYTADSYGFKYDADAERANAKFLKQTYDDGYAALLARPPIPDWEAIGKKAEAQRRWGTMSSIMRIGIGIAGLFF